MINHIFGEVSFHAGSGAREYGLLGLEAQHIQASERAASPTRPEARASTFELYYVQVQ